MHYQMGAHSLTCETQNVYQSQHQYYCNNSELNPCGKLYYPAVGYMDAAAASAFHQISRISLDDSPTPSDPAPRAPTPKGDPPKTDTTNTPTKSSAAIISKAPNPPEGKQLNSVITGLEAMHRYCSQIEVEAFFQKYVSGEDPSEDDYQRFYYVDTNNVRLEWMVNTEIVRHITTFFLKHLVTSMKVQVCCDGSGSGAAVQPCAASAED